ncbi:MAG: hypothetical protein IJN92_09135 [Lachnospiraceae bacterium]|nr:hypothetical protein [Lachnospiraceae bacterium]
MKAIERGKTVAWKATLIILAALLLYVFYFSMYDWNSALFFMTKLSAPMRIAITVASIGLLLSVFLLIWKLLGTKNDRFLAKLAYFLLGVFFILQIFYLFSMKVGLRYDALKIVDEAVSLLKTGAVSGEHLDGYFARYTNNYGILFLTAGLLKLFDLWGILGDRFQNAVPILGIINIFMIDMGIFFGWKLAFRCKGAKTAFICLLWAVLNPVFLIWTPFYYTNTVSMGLMMMAIYGIYRLFEESDGNNTNGTGLTKAVFCGMVLMAGCSIRATVYITIIAAFCYFLFREKRRGEFAESILLKLACILMGMVLVIGIQKIVEEKAIPFDTTDTAFPAMHWIAMGAGGQGVYNILDEYYTMGFATKEEKNLKDRELFVERVKGLGAKGYGKLMLDKLRLTWSDGSGGYLSELGVSQSYLPVHKYFLGSKSDFTAAYGAVFYSFSLFLIFIGVLADLKKKHPDFLYVIKLNLLGGFLFHMLWEAGTIYSIGFMTLLPLGMIDGFSVFEIVAEKTVKGRGKYVCAFPAVVLVVLFWVKSHVFFEEMYITNEACVNQFLYQCDESELLLNDELYVQTFVGDKEFNRLGVQVKNQSGPDNQSNYHIVLLDSEKRLVAEETVLAADISGYGFITLSFDTIDGRENEGCYYVVVEKAGGRAEEGLAFLSYNTGNYDAYQKGNMQVYENISIEEFAVSGNNLEESDNIDNLRDLAFCVYNQKEAPYF